MAGSVTQSTATMPTSHIPVLSTGGSMGQLYHQAGLVQEQKQLRIPSTGREGQHRLSNMPPKRVLKLRNLVSHEELEDDAEFADISEDIRLECSDHGQVLRVFIPRVKDGYPSSVEGFIFVEFANGKSAQNAAINLDGRKFAENVVEVEYFDDKKFVAGVYA